jgi:hypothetical protein
VQTLFLGKIFYAEEFFKASRPGSFTFAEVAVSKYKELYDKIIARARLSQGTIILLFFILLFSGCHLFSGRSSRIPKQESMS